MADGTVAAHRPEYLLVSCSPGLLSCFQRLLQAVRPVGTLELEVDAGVPPLHRSVAGVAVQVEDAVVHAQPQRAGERDLRAAADVAAKVRLVAAFLRRGRLVVDSPPPRSGRLKTPPST